MIAGTQNTSYPSKRRAERRTGMNELVREVATAWLTQGTDLDLKSMLVSRVRQLVQAKTVRFNELPSTSPIRVGQPVRSRDYAAFAIPAADAARKLVLEASFSAERGIDDWSCQLLEAAASLATLLFEAERLASSQDQGSRPKADGAAPLIGSSLVMQGLRERVERVATTDFTVLIEGPIDP